MVSDYAMRLFLIFFGTMMLSILLSLAIIYVYIKTNPFPQGSGVDERSMAFILVPAIDVLLSLFSATLFLNFVKSIRTNATYSFLSFFLFPILLCLYFIVTSTALNGIQLIVVIPFFSILLTNFIFYRIHINRELLRNEEW